MRLEESQKVWVAQATKGVRFGEYAVGNAVVVADTIAQKFVSAVAQEFQVSFSDTRIGPEELSRDIPNVGEEQLRNLDKHGIVKVGTTVQFDDILVGKVVPKEAGELTADERLIIDIYGKNIEESVDKSLRYPFRDPGVVTGVQVRSRHRFHCEKCGTDMFHFTHLKKCFVCGGQPTRLPGDDLPPPIELEVSVRVLITRSLAEGDVLADKNGNHYIVARIAPARQMPRFGRRWVEVLVSPQSSFNLHRSHQLVQWEEQKLIRLRKCFGDEIRLTKETCQQEEKFSSRYAGPYSLITQLPLGETDEVNPFPGQRVGANLVRLFVKNGLVINAAELFSIKADAVAGRVKTYEALLTGKPVVLDVPESSFELVRLLRSLGCCVKFISADGAESEEPVKEAVGIRLAPATSADVFRWSFGEVRKPETLNYRTMKPEMSGLLCERIFGPVKDLKCACGKYKKLKFKDVICEKCGVQVTQASVRRRRMGHIELNAPVFHPWFTEPVAEILGLTQENLRKVVYFEGSLATQDGQAETGPAAIKSLLRQKGMNPDGIILRQLPVLPPGLRQMVELAPAKFSTDDVNELYRRVINRANRLRRLIDIKALESTTKHEQRLLQQAVDHLFDNRNLPQRPVTDNKDQPLRSLADKLEQVLRRLLRKRVDYCGKGTMAPEPHLSFSQIGLPEKMMFVLFKPWLMRGIVEAPEHLAGNYKTAERLVRQQPENVMPQLRALCDQVSAGRKVLVVGPGESPVVLPLQPVVIEGEAIRLNPKTAETLGVKFVGEQVLVLVPLSDKALAELDNPTPVPEAECVSALAQLTVKDMVALALNGEPIRLSVLDKVALGVV